MGNCLIGQAEDHNEQFTPIINRESSTSADSPDSLPQQVPYQRIPLFHPSPNEARLATDLTEEQQIKIAKRIGLIQQLSVARFDASKKHRSRECPICMLDFEDEDAVRRLPCAHLFHRSCIDDWLMRSPICPSCMQPVESAVLSAFDNP